MRHLLSFLVGLLMAVSLATAASAHAVERAGCVEGTPAGAIHFEGDADQVPADADGDYPHHHGACHGHHVAAGTTGADPIGLARTPGALAAVPATALSSAEGDSALRPPQA